MIGLYVKKTAKVCQFDIISETSSCRREICHSLRNLVTQLPTCKHWYGWCL